MGDTHRAFGPGDIYTLFDPGIFQTDRHILNLQNVCLRG